MSSTALVQSAPSPPLWVIRGRVYDLEPWFHQHPAGSFILEQTRGQDCTALFESYHALSTRPVNKMLDLYYVREADPSEMDVCLQHPWEETPAYDAIKAYVREYFKTRSRKAPTWAKVWYLIVSSLLILSTVQWYWTGGFLNSVVMGVLMWFCCADAGHMGMHFAIFESAFANLCFGSFFSMWVVVPSVWVRQHVILHHAHTNHHTRDPDLHHFDHVIPMYRLTAGTSWKTAYGAWRYTMPIITLNTGLFLLLVEGPLVLIKRTYLSVPTALFFSKRELVQAWTQFTASFLVMSSVIWHFNMFRALLPWFVYGNIFYVFSQISHANESSAGGNSDTSTEWALAQIRSSKGDYQHKSYLWMFLSIGLNAQAVHHLFPNVHWTHFPHIYEGVLQAAGEPLLHRTFCDSVCNFLKYVGVMNDCRSSNVSCRES